MNYGTINGKNRNNSITLAALTDSNTNGFFENVFFGIKK